MSREIKFRGWHKGLNKWVYGFLTRNKNGVYFIENEDSHFGIADVSSICQYTGLKDKNGKEIYEGDIVKYSFRDGNDINTRFMQIYNDGVNFKMKELHRDYWLEKVDGVLQIKHGHLTKYRGETNLLCDVSGLVVYWYEVIGNIYEHSHLLEGTA